MDAEIERLRRRERELEDRVARLEAERGDGLRRPDQDNLLDPSRKF